MKPTIPCASNHPLFKPPSLVLPYPTASSNHTIILCGSISLTIWEEMYTGQPSNVTKHLSQCCKQHLSQCCKKHVSMLQKTRVNVTKSTRVNVKTLKSMFKHLSQCYKRHSCQCYKQHLSQCCKKHVSMLQKNTCQCYKAFESMLKHSSQCLNTSQFHKKHSCQSYKQHMSMLQKTRVNVSKNTCVNCFEQARVAKEAVHRARREDLAVQAANLQKQEGRKMFYFLQPFLQPFWNVNNTLVIMYKCRHTHAQLTTTVLGILKLMFAPLQRTSAIERHPKDAPIYR